MMKKAKNKEEALDIILTLINEFKINTFEIQVFKDRQKFLDSCKSREKN